MTPSATRPFDLSLSGRAARVFGLPFDAIAASLVVLAGLHFSVTTLRTDRGWSQDIPAFYVAALAGLTAATIGALYRRRPLADASAFVVIAAGTMVFAYFSGRVGVGPSIEEMGRPPALRGLYIGATAVFAACMAWIVPVRPVDGFLLAALVFASPATRVLLRWAPDGFDVAPICLSLAAVVHARALDTRPIRWNGPAKAALAFAGIVALSACFSSSKQIGIPAAARTAAQAIAFVAALDYANREDGGRRFLKMAALVGMLVSATELFIYNEFVKIVGFGSAWSSRLESFSIHPNLVAPYSAVGAVLGLGLALTADRWLARGLGLAGFIAGTAAVYLHRSGGATAGLGCGIVILTANWICARLVNRGRIFGSIPLATLVAIPIVVFIAAVATPSFAPRLTGGGESGKINVGTRVEFWRASRMAILAHPIVGLGPKNVEARSEYVDESIEANIDWSNHPHNLMMELGETLGLTGVVAFVVLVYFVGRSVRRTYLTGSSSARGLAGAGGAALAVILVDAAFDHGFAEFAVVSDMFWWACLLACAPEPDAAEGTLDTALTSGRGQGNFVLSILATGALFFAGVVPLCCTALEQSTKWIHFWTTQSHKFESFRDAEGRMVRYRWALWLAPERADLRLSLADSLYAAGRVNEALAEVDWAVKDAPHTAESLLRAALFYCNLGNPPLPEHVAMAFSLYEPIVKLGNPDERAQAHLGMARCLGMQGKKSEALVQLSIALAKSPQMPITVFGFRRLPPSAEGQAPDTVYRLVGPDALSVTEAAMIGLDSYRPRLDTDFNATWGPMARLAESLIHIGRADLAIEELRRIEEKAPSKRVNIPSLLSQAHMATRQYSEALTDIDRAIENGGWHPAMSSMRARVLESLGRVNDALAESKRFVDGNKDSITWRMIARDGYRRFAYSQQSTSRYLQASESFVKAAIHDDNAPDRVRFYIDAATAAMRGSTIEAGKADQYLDVVDRHFLSACSESGSIEWGDFDQGKMVELGAQLCRAAPGRGNVVFERLLDLSQDRPSVGAFSMVIGAGRIALEQLLAQKQMDDFVKTRGRVGELERVIDALGPRKLVRG